MPVHAISLFELLRTARLGPCVRGAPAADGVAWLGAGEGIVGDRRGTTGGSAFVRRSLQVFFRLNDITSFGLYFRYLDGRSEAFDTLGIERPTNWSRATTRRDVESALTQEGIAWHDWSVGDGLELDSGAVISFDGAGTLDSIQFARPRP